MSRDATHADIEREVNEMDLGRISTFTTKATLEMLKRRRDVVAFVLFVMGVIVGIAVLAHEPGDDGTRHPLGNAASRFIRRRGCS